MDETSGRQQAPVVFVSYSHDTPEHKRWVGELASTLRRNGVDVILDQWETGPGDDLPKFMEKSVGRADRVLVVCSDAYVQKADDGQGGAGYEAMIVTGELAKNLSMNKFVPIIRQSHRNVKKPKFLETKYHIDFSEDERFDDAFEELLRTIHRAPKNPKPPLGENPFVDEAKREQNRAASPGFRLQLSVSMEVPANAQDAYFAALELAHNDDRIAWRKFLQKAASTIGNDLQGWRSGEGNALPQKVEDLSQWALPGLTSVSVPIAIALAGVESHVPYFANQVGLIDEFLHPAGWERSGNTIVVQFPEFIAFAYQALLGAVAMQTQQAETAQRLALVEIPQFYGSNESLPLFASTQITGWPESLNHTCTIAWAFLQQLPEHWPWLSDIFGNADYFKAALSAYYAMLNVVEFLNALNSDVDFSNSQNIRLTVPVSFTVMGETISRRALRLLEENRQVFAEMWRTAEADSELKLTRWDQWVQAMEAWIFSVYRDRVWRYSPFHSPFVKNL
jgi:hypothetical protein